MINLLIAVLDAAYKIATLLILIRCILSFLIPSIGNNSFTQFIFAVTEPLLSPFRNVADRFLPAMAIDLSPIIAMGALYVVYNVLRAVILTLNILL